MYKQIIDVINLGVVVLDTDLNIIDWNRWMELQSNHKREEMIGKNLLDQYPHLNNQNFLRSCKSVKSFGNFIFFSQKLHNYLFPFDISGYHANFFEKMQQSCTMAPLQDESGKITQIVITVQNVTEGVFLEQSLKMMSQQDGLTGIHNRRYLDKRLEEEFNRYKRTGSIFSVVMMDIDNFKFVNDTYGHNTGDQVLKKISQCCSNLIRNCDILARFGGEEFCIVLPDTDLNGALNIGEKVRNKIELTSTPLEEKGEIGVTISLGAAEVNKDIGSFERLIKNADTALYHSKQNGKNRITAYSVLFPK